ncbi:MAG: adenylosuccinate lyase [Gammaproteobacteria bacterium WSBS_2016_MAG_OTU1]
MTLPLDALTSLDGRYQSTTHPLAAHFSERALIQWRAQIEIEWLKTLMPLFSYSSDTSIDSLIPVAANIQRADMAETVKQTELTIRHDVKAVEYWLCDELKKHDLAHLQNLVHFGCTSWDINNIAQGKMIFGAMQEHLIPQLELVIASIEKQAMALADTPMLSRTHGQPASPTTMGKEFANFYARLTPRLQKLREWRPTGKMNGATGNYNAHYIARPDIDWQQLSQKFVESQNMIFASHTTQIEPYDDLASFFNLMSEINNILLDFCRDMWTYIALEYFCQQTVEAEVGSSTMPHKINPIDFENGEGNLGLANALFIHFANKLPISRWQRDLSDSTVLRSIGTAFGYTFLAWQSIGRGLERITINTPKLNADLDNNWSVLTEAVQTLLRSENAADDAYEQLKTFSRGATVDKEYLHNFIESLPISDDAKSRLLALSPHSYCGIAAQLAKQT